MTGNENELLLPDTTKLKKHTTVGILNRLVVVLIIVFLVYFAMSLQSYSLNEWMQNRIKVKIFHNSTVNNTFISCGKVNKSDPAYHKNERVQQEVAKWQMYQSIALTSVAFFTSFLYTVYTDVFGRRFLFILSLSGVSFYITLTAFIMYFDMDFKYLVITNAIYGLTGTSYGLLSAMYSYIADVTATGKERTIGIVMADVSIAVADTLGSLTVGFFIETKGYIYPIFTGAGIDFVALLVVVFVLSESLAKQDRIKPPPLLESIRRPFLFYTHTDFKGYRSMFIMLVISFIFADMLGVHRQSLETLYQLGMPFCWSPSTIGIFATVRSFGQSFFGLATMKSLQRCMSDASIAMISLVSCGGSLVLEALAFNDTMLYLVTIPAILNTLICSLIRSTMSGLTSTNQQGALFASILVVQTACSFITGITDNAIYAASLTFFNGFIFLVLAGYCVISFGCLAVFTVLKKKRFENECLVNEENLKGEK